MELFVRRLQVLGALGDRGFERQVGGLGGAERGRQLMVGAMRFTQQHRHQQQDQDETGEVDRKENHAGPP